MNAMIRKLRGRSLAELVDRIRQGTSRWLERRGVGDIGELEGSRLAERIGDGADSARVILGPFFASIDDRDATIAALKAVDPTAIDTLRQRADKIATGRFDLLGFTDLSFGDPPDWWLDPVRNVRAPSRHWSEIDFLNAEVVGDHKLLWELSRHQALVTLAQAWWVTGERDYLDTCSALLESWLEANPPKLGVNWGSSLEVSFRSIAWVWVLALAGSEMSPALRKRVLGCLAIAGRHVEQHLSTYFSPNTHLTGEALGLFILGTALPQLKDAARWRNLGARILLDMAPVHVRADGSYVEQSTWYHRYTTDFYLHFLVLAGRSSMDVRGRIEKPLGVLLEHLAWLSRPDGSMPLIGDDDGGRLLFLDERTGHDARSPLAVGAVVLNRPDLAGPALASAELVWLLGAPGLSAFNALEARVPPQLSRAFRDGGIHVMRTGWDANASMMTVDAGPHGFMNGGHAHADALSIDLSVQGRPVLVDPGTFTYTVGAAWRDRFRETSSHNAATVDGCGSAVPAGPFQWSSRAEARQTAWYEAEGVVLMAGSHDGFRRLRPRIAYTRSIVQLTPGLWIVRDEFETDEERAVRFEHEVAAHWQCAQGILARQDGDRITLAREASDVLFLGVAEPSAGWKVTDGQVSPTYGVKSDAPHLECVRRSALPACLTTVLSGDRQFVATRLVEEEGPAAIRVEGSGRRGLFATRGSVCPAWLDTDAAVIWVELDASDTPVVVTAAAVSRLTVMGKTILPGGPVLDGLTMKPEMPMAAV